MFPVRSIAFGLHTHQQLHQPRRLHQVRHRRRLKRDGHPHHHVHHVRNTSSRQPDKQNYTSESKTSARRRQPHRRSPSHAAVGRRGGEGVYGPPTPRSGLCPRRWDWPSWRGSNRRRFAVAEGNRGVGYRHCPRAACWHWCRGPGVLWASSARWMGRGTAGVRIRLLSIVGPWPISGGSRAIGWAWLRRLDGGIETGKKWARRMGGT